MITKETKMLECIPARISTSEVLNLINSGVINSKYLLFLKTLSEFNDETISAWLNINVKTYRTYKKTESKIKEDIQEHAVMLLALIKHGIDVFGTNENFNKWLKTENFYFSQKEPINYLNTISGIKFIDDQLTGIEYGDNV